MVRKISHKPGETRDREELKQVIAYLKDERASLVEDVNYDVSFIGGDRLVRYNHYDAVLELLNEKLYKEEK